MTQNQLYPCVVISIDFEMGWGMHEICGHKIDGYRKNLEQVSAIVPHMLKMLHDREIRATWATVGALGLRSWDEYFAMAPRSPAYLNSNLRIDYSYYAESDPNGSLHFAPNLVEEIVNTEGQELGSHSFSHVYFRENGVTSSDFIADSKAVNSVFNDRYNTNPVSLVFPKNQSAFEFLLSECGIHIWRGNENVWYFDAVTEAGNSYTARSLRLLESINPWIKRSMPISGNKCQSSMFVRFNLPEMLWRLQVTRLKNELNSLSGNEIFHIWFHPHNLGDDTSNRMSRFEKVLDLIVTHFAKRVIYSKNMSDFVKK